MSSRPQFENDEMTEHRTNLPLDVVVFLMACENLRLINENSELKYDLMEI